MGPNVSKHYIWLFSSVMIVINTRVYSLSGFFFLSITAQDNRAILSPFFMACVEDQWKIKGWFIIH